MPPPPPFGWSPSPAPFHYAGADKRNPRPSFARHCEERSDEAIQTLRPDWIASLALAMTTRKGILAARRRPSFAASDDEGTTKIPAHDPEKWRPVFGPRSCATKKGSGAPKGALSNQCPRQARLRALPPPVLLPRKTGEGDHTKCGGGGGAPPFGAHACGTHHRLLPRWLSSRTGFPAAFGAKCRAHSAVRVVSPAAPNNQSNEREPRLSTLRADRSLCRSTGDPKPPGCGLAIPPAGTAPRSAVTACRPERRPSPSEMRRNY